MNKKELKEKWKKFVTDNPQWYRKIGNHHYFRSRYASKFWLKEIETLNSKIK